MGVYAEFMQVPKPNIPYCHRELLDVRVHGELDNFSSYLYSAKEMLNTVDCMHDPSQGNLNMKGFRAVIFVFVSSCPNEIM